MTARQKYWLGLTISLTVGLLLKLLPLWSSYQSWSSKWSGELKQFASEAGGAFWSAPQK